MRSFFSDLRNIRAILRIMAPQVDDRIFPLISRRFARSLRQHVFMCGERSFELRPSRGKWC
jgi:hypothetical protein